VLKGILVLQVLKETLALKGFKVKMDHKVLKVLKAPKGIRVRME
jgi:hypothetical protein